MTFDEMQKVQREHDKQALKLYATTKRYLGDSVYATFDGYNIWLTTENGLLNDPSNLIALEPQVIGALLRYQKDLYAEKE